MCDRDRQTKEKGARGDAIPQTSFSIPLPEAALGGPSKGKGGSPCKLPEKRELPSLLRAHTFTCRKELRVKPLPTQALTAHLKMVEISE